MAFHLNEGQMNEEKSKHRKINDFEWEADIFVPDESQAIMNDFWAHVMELTHHLETRTIPVPEGGEGEPEYLQSWMDVHYCFNDVNQPCQAPYLTFETPLPDPQEPDNPCDSIAVWDANEGYTNMAIGDLRKVEVEGVWKVYAVKNLGFVHYDPSGPNGHYGWTYQYDCPN
jgi:hypothetical protein